MCFACNYVENEISQARILFAKDTWVLRTKLTGRYIEFEMFPLNFNEYLEMKKFFKKNVSSNLLEEFDNYLIEGGFPKAVQFDSIQDRRTYISSVITEIFEKDIKRRVRVKNTSVYNKVQQYLINNFGSTTSLTNILSDLEKSGMRIKHETLNRYIKITVITVIFRYA